MSGLRTVRRKISEPRVRASIARILESNVLCSISTVTRGNRAHINTAYFAYSPQFEFYFLSDPGSLHSRNLSTNDSMAMTVFSSSQVWGESDCGLQLFGTCREAMGRRAKDAERVYGRRFPLYANLPSSSGKDGKRQAARLRSYRFYRFVPRQAKVFDERVFGGGVFVLATVPRPGRRP